MALLYFALLRMLYLNFRILSDIFLYKIVSPNAAIIYSPIYGKNNTKKNGHTATCKLAIAKDIKIKNIPYLHFFVCKNLSIKYTVQINSIKVTSCALAAT